MVRSRFCHHENHRATRVDQPVGSFLDQLREPSRETMYANSVYAEKMQMKIKIIIYQVVNKNVCKPREVNKLNKFGKLTGMNLTVNYRQ